MSLFIVQNSESNHFSLINVNQICIISLLKNLISKCHSNGTIVTIFLFIFFSILS